MSEGLAALREPFPPTAVKWRPGAKAKDGNTAIALGYVDARDVMERFDAAFGAFNWQDEYSWRWPEQGDKNPAVEATISVWDEKKNGWVRKSDTGYSNDPGTTKETEPLKAAYSDAFKRAAVKWGVGRDLYDLPQLWLPIDQYGRFTESPVWDGKVWNKPGQARSAAPAPARATKSAAPAEVAPASTAAQDVDVSVEKISDGQRKKILAKATDLGLTEAQVKAAWALLFQKNSSKDLTVAEFQQALLRLDDPKFVDTLREVQSIGAPA